jgi:hypothetical protein
MRPNSDPQISLLTLMRGALVLVRLVARPLGYLAFVVALAALSFAAKALGDRDELGYFTDRLATMIWRYPEVTRRGVQIAWVVWGLAFLVALPPLDPLATPWDEAVLAAAAAIVLWRRFVGGHRAER